MADSVDYLECYFDGRVQGVGFRYTTLEISKQFEVSGTVRNLPDGRVELLAEGDGRELRGFLGEIEREMAGFIRAVKVSYSQRERQFRGFQVAR